MKITPVLMSGGAGTRLWPLSRQARPKQFHPLGGERTLIQDTALRVTGDLFGPPIVVANAAHESLVRGQLAAIGLTPRAILLEPAGRNTGPAAAAVAAFVAREDPEALLLLLHADNRVRDVAEFRRAVAAGIPAAAAGALVVFGIHPTGPETGYGYIRAAAGDGAARQVDAFVEKPDLASAQAYVADPAYSWNAGVFLFSAGLFLAEVRSLVPAIAEAAEAAVEAAQGSGDAVILGDAFLAAPSEAIDTAIFEKTNRAVVVDADIGWSDVGTWQALWSDAPQDAAGNVGATVTAGATGCLVISDGTPVVLAGVADLAVIVENGVVLVARRDDPEAMRAAVAALRASGREDLL
ncbi:mannose-1-phosphate guanylyltransferase [Phenylobacterium sp.]|uniref:mannose-1-phosphate guanylyltransferase n=1 Tax=Phenylobacterium sp. TaxID=1871053 RepID=UPI003982D9CE